MSGINVFNQSISNIQKSQKNLMAISDARRKLEQQEAEFEFEKKKNAVELEGLGLKNDVTRTQIEQRKQQIKNQQSIAQAVLDGKFNMIDQAEDEEKTKIKESTGQAKAIAKADPYVLAPYMTADGNMGVRPLANKQNKQDYTRKDVIAHASEQFKNKSSGDTRSMNDFVKESEGLFSGEEMPAQAKAAKQTKQFKNKKTGQLDTFEKDGSGKWIKIN